MMMRHGTRNITCKLRSGVRNHYWIKPENSMTGFIMLERRQQRIGTCSPSEIGMIHKSFGLKDESFS